MRRDLRRPNGEANRLGYSRLLDPVLMLVIVVALGQGGCASLDPEVEQSPTVEASEQAAVKLALVEVLGVDAAAVSVAADGDTVTLGGFVANEAQRNEALAAARRVVDGTPVVDEMQVRQ